MAQAARHPGAHAFDGRWTGWLVLIVGVALVVGVFVFAGGGELTGSLAMSEPNLAP